MDLMKTKKEILGNFHDQALGKLLENKINLGLAESRIIILKPGEECNQIQKNMVGMKKSITNFGKMLEIIEGMMKEKNDKKV